MSTGMTPEWNHKIDFLCMMYNDIMCYQKKIKVVAIMATSTLVAIFIFFIFNKFSILKFNIISNVSL